MILDLIVPGGEPSDIVTALRSAACPAALLLITRSSTRLASQLATLVRAEGILVGDRPVDDVVKAIRSLKELVDWRREPQCAVPPSQPSDDVYEALVDLMVELFEQAGLHKFPHRYAIRMRIIGMTDDGAAKDRGIKEPSFRRDVSAANATLPVP